MLAETSRRHFTIQMDIWKLDARNDNIKPVEMLAWRAHSRKKMSNVGCENGGKRAMRKR